MPKKANTPKPAKPAGKAAENASNAVGNAKHGKRVTRTNTQSRDEVRRNTIAEKGHPK